MRSIYLCGTWFALLIIPWCPLGHTVHMFFTPMHDTPYFLEFSTILNGFHTNYLAQAT